MAEVLPLTTSKVATVTSTAATTLLQRTGTLTKTSANGASYTNAPKKISLKNKGLGNNTGSVVLVRIFARGTAVTAVTDTTATVQIAPGSTVVLPLALGGLDSDITNTNNALILAASVAGTTTFTAGSSTASFPATGSFSVPTVANSVTGAAAAGPAIFTYTGVSGSTFTGAVWVSGTGDIAAGAVVTGNTYNANVTAKLAAGDTTTNFLVASFVNDDGGH